MHKSNYQPIKFGQNPFIAPHEATELILVRHGASQTAVPGEMFPMVDGQGDPALAPLGREQAAKVGARLATETIDSVYVTRLQRTVETAAPLLEATGMTATVSPHLHEIGLGEWEGGLGRQKLEDPNDPIVVSVRTTGSYDAIPGAEQWDDFSARVQTGIDELIVNHPGENVVAFVHGGVIAAASRNVVGASERFGAVDNCSITHLVHHNGTIWLRLFNDTSHLRPLFTRSYPG